MPLTISRSRGLIHVRGAGFFSLDEVVAHFDDLSRAVGDTRRHWATVRAIIDLRRSQTQSQPIAQFIRERTSAMFLPQDRFAIIASSPLHQAQLRRIHTEQQFGIFSRPHDAGAFVAANPYGDAAARGTGMRLVRTSQL